MEDFMKIFGTIISVVILLSFLSVMVNMFSDLGEQKCQPYKDTIAQRDTEVQGLKGQLTQTEQTLGECRNNYETLIKENITKKDIEEIKGYYNITQVQITTLNQKVDQTNENYYNFYHVLLNNYRWSLTINFAIGFSLLGIEILSFAFLKSEFAMFVINAIIKHRKKKEEHHD